MGILKGKSKPNSSRWFNRWGVPIKRDLESARMVVVPEFRDTEEFELLLVVESESCGLFLKGLGDRLVVDGHSQLRMRQKIRRHARRYAIGAVTIPVAFDQYNDAAGDLVVCRSTFKVGERLVPMGMDHVSETRADEFLDSVEKGMSSACNAYQSLTADGPLIGNLAIGDWLFKLVYFAMCAEPGIERFVDDVERLNRTDANNSWRIIDPSDARSVYSLAKDMVSIPHT